MVYDGLRLPQWWRFLSTAPLKSTTKNPTSKTAIAWQHKNREVEREGGRRWLVVSDFFSTVKGNTSGGEIVAVELDCEQMEETRNFGAKVSSSYLILTFKRRTGGAGFMVAHGRVVVGSGSELGQVAAPVWPARVSFVDARMEAGGGNRGFCVLHIRVPPLCQNQPFKFP